jgi:hypothetical protein
MRKYIQLLSILAFGFLTFNSFGQRGPGGVSSDTVNPSYVPGNPEQQEFISECRVWFDASQIKGIGDGDPMSVWYDSSPSQILDTAIQYEPLRQPTYRSDINSSINGFPALSFSQGQLFELSSSSDINLEDVVTEKTIFVAFRTGNDVNTRQMIYEEGGGWRGLNTYIYNQELYITGYDLNQNGVDNDGSQTDPDGTPWWGHVYRKAPIQPNTSYVLTMVFWGVEGNNNGGALDGDIYGFLNGSQSLFGNLLWNNDGYGANNVGSLGEHPDPIGIGAVRKDSFTEEGPISDETGIHPFLGRIAEVILYNERLNDAKRIIVQNYLGAKYFADIIIDDRYDYEASYGFDVIGLAQTVGGILPGTHNLSKGRNPFTLGSDMAGAMANKFAFVGHNGLSLDTTSINTPEADRSIVRWRRVYRLDKQQNDVGDFLFEIDSDDIPTAPSGFSKFVLLVDDSGGNFPSFGSNSEVYEMEDAGAGNYELEIALDDGTFFTFGYLRPTVSVVSETNFAFEANSPIITEGRLNYIPASTVTVNYEFSPGSATDPEDYIWNNTSSIDFATQTFFVSTDIVDNSDPENTETYSFNLLSSPSLNIGNLNGDFISQVISIYDNDSDPKIQFDDLSLSFNESEGIVNIGLSRTGSQPSDDATFDYRINTSSGYFPLGGTATPNTDYSFSAGSITFQPMETQKTIELTINDDIIDEIDETIVLEITNLTATGVNFENGRTQTEISIIDNDDPPSAFFISPTSQFTETTNDASAVIELSAPSAKEVTIDYSIVSTLPFPATGGGTDYTTAATGQIQFPASSLAYPDTLQRLNLQLVSDNTDEPDETIEIELTNIVNGVFNVAVPRHVMTIKDYSEFEFQGAAGIGKELDNIIWIRADQQNVSNNGNNLQTIGNSSPHNFSISQSNDNRRAQLFTSTNLLNGYNVLRFDGSDYYTLENYGLINSGSFYDSKDFFLVIRPNSSYQSERQLIYKQGGGSRGFSIYLEQKTGNLYDLYFHAWNNPDDDPEGNLSPWGATGSGNATTTYALYEDISPGTAYVVSCHYDRLETPSSDRLRIYVNGEKGTSVNADDVGRIYVHTGAASLGGVDGSALYHDNTDNDNDYHGDIAEFIGYSDAPMTESRRIILTNYLSGKYAINLINDQFFNVAEGSTNFNRNIAGIGYEDSNDFHGDARGPSLLRVSSSNSFADADGDDFLIWGHNNVPLDNSWPYSNSNLPSSIYERSGRIWKFFKSGTVGEVDILLNFSSLENSDIISASNLVLLRHNNVDPQNFSDATIIPAINEEDEGVTMLFRVSNIENGDYFAIASTASSAIPLPIELLAFDAKLNGSIVDLKWETASEINNDFFIIERAGEDMVWTPILERAGAGNSNNFLSYQEKDRDPLEGISYYRLKQVDFNGDFTYSDPVSIFNQPVSGNEDVFMYPNPSTVGSVYLRLPFVTRDFETSVRLYDLSGKLIRQTQFDSNSEIFEFHYGNIPPGIYFIQINSDAINETKKLVVE